MTSWLLAIGHVGIYGKVRVAVQSLARSHAKENT